MPKALTSYWVMPSPSSKVWSTSTSSHHTLDMMAAVASTIFPSYLPLLVMWPTTWMRAISGSPSLVITQMATHLPSGEIPFEVGLKERQSPQLGASHGVTASSLHQGPFTGTWLASTSRGEGHIFGPSLHRQVGTGLGRSSGAGLCQGSGRQQRSCDCLGSL